MISMAAFQRRITLLEASRHPVQRQAVRMHVIDCTAAERPARLAAIEAAEPDVFHIVRVIVDPVEQRAV
jgi:hypothetical protein